MAQGADIMAYVKKDISSVLFDELMSLLPLHKEKDKNGEMLFTALAMVACRMVDREKMCEEAPMFQIGSLGHTVEYIFIKTSAN